jgi:hypothetical protein
VDDFHAIVEVITPAVQLALDCFTPGAPPAVRPETLGPYAAACHEASCPH